MLCIYLVIKTNEKQDLNKLMNKLNIYFCVWLEIIFENTSQLLFEQWTDVWKEVDLMHQVGEAGGQGYLLSGKEVLLSAMLLSDTPYGGTLWLRYNNELVVNTRTPPEKQQNLGKPT